MWKFIRRLFILLVLFSIIFLVYRYVNPIGASIFIEKIKIIPTQISELMWSNIDEETNITGTTLAITWDVDVLIEDAVDDLDSTDDENLTWLEELNLEIEQILWTADDWTWDNIEVTWDVKNTEVTWDLKNIVELTWTNSKEINLEDEEDIAETWTNIDNLDTTPVWLTDADYQQMEDVFGNLVE